MIAQTPQIITNAQLAAELNELGVYFLRSDNRVAADQRFPPVRLMAALAASDEARLRLALIPLLLRHPTFVCHVETARQQISTTNQIVFKCYYTAAWLLQQKYRLRLTAFTDHWASLPDLYGVDLDILPFINPDDGLQKLAERHCILSGKSINWLGTYEHAAQRWLTHMEQRQRWNL